MGAVSTGRSRGSSFFSEVYLCSLLWKVQKYAVCVMLAPRRRSKIRTYHDKAGKVGARGDVRVIVLEDVQGETVTIGSNSGATEFDEFLPEAQKVLDSVEWRGK